MANLMLSVISFLAGVISVSSFLYANYKYGILNWYHLRQLDKALKKLHSDSENLKSEDEEGKELFKLKIKELELLYYS